MQMRISTRNVFAATVAVIAVVALDSRSGKETEVLAALTLEGVPPLPVQRAAATAWQRSHAAGGIDMAASAQLTMVEARHFDIYNRYRTFSSAGRERVSERGSADPQAEAAGTDSGTALRACTARTLIAQALSTPIPQRPACIEKLPMWPINVRIPRIRDCGRP